jgi:hypothetical protein
LGRHDKNVNYDDPAIELALGVNHVGMIYVLSPMGNKDYGYNPDGNYKFNFGEESERAGQLSSIGKALKFGMNYP